MHKAQAFFWLSFPIMSVYFLIALARTPWGICAHISFFKCDMISFSLTLLAVERSGIWFSYTRI